MPVHWGILGTGQISHSFVPDIQLCEDTAITVVWGRTRERAQAFATQHGIPRATDDLLDALSSADVDAVYLATPYATHHSIARAAIEAGKHVLVEKPMAMDARQAEELFALAAERGVLLLEGMWMKYNPIIRTLIDQVDSGRIGELRSITAAFSFPIPESSASRFDPARSPGALLDQGIYPVTLAHLLLGAPESVHARGEIRDDGVDLDVHATLEYGDGRFAHVASSMLAHAATEAVIAGTRGWITIDGLFWAARSITVHADDLATMFTRPERIEVEWEGNGYVPMIRSFQASLAAGLLEDPLHTAADSTAALRSLDEIRARATG